MLLEAEVFLDLIDCAIDSTLTGDLALVD